MKRWIKANHASGYQDIFEENNDLLKYLALGQIKLQAGKEITCATNDYEVVLVLLAGVATIRCEGQQWSRLGGRSSVFEGKATAVYIPCQSEYTITAETSIAIAVCKSKADEKYAPFVVKPEEVQESPRGKDHWRRTVYDIIAANCEGRVNRIVVGETINASGHWSSYPPHKHDGEFYPKEPNFEEIYYYQMNPEQGFGAQLHYTKDGSIDDAYIVRHGDSFAVERGYHPLSAAGGYQVYYLWFMAGDTGRNLKPYDDPDHAWLK